MKIHSNLTENIKYLRAFDFETGITKHPNPNQSRNSISPVVDFQVDRFDSLPLYPASTFSSFKEEKNIKINANKRWVGLDGLADMAEVAAAAP